MRQPTDTRTLTQSINQTNSILDALTLRQTQRHAMIFTRQGVCLALHYVLLAALVPLPVAIGHVFLGGWLTATIVTVTHTAEEFSVGDKPSSSMEDDTSYVETQFKTTRDAVCKDPLSE